MRHIAATFSLAVAGVLLSTAPVAQASNDTTNVVPKAVGLSYQGTHLALIASVNGSVPKLVLSGPSGGNAHVVPIPGDCTPTSIRWAPNWDRLAVVTDCHEGQGSKVGSGAIWLLDGGSGKVRLIAKVVGSASHVDWTSDGKNIAVLYAPEGDVKRVAIVPMEGGTPQLVTPAGLDVREFGYTRFANILVFTATPTASGASAMLPSLFVQYPDNPAAPIRVFDPNTAEGPLHNLYVTQPQISDWGNELLLFLGKRSRDSESGNLYLVPGSIKKGTTPINLNPRLELSSFTLDGLAAPGGTGTFATQLVNGKTEVVKVAVGANFAKRTGLMFALPGTITDGRGPQSLSTTISGMISGSRIAFLQEPSPGGPVLVRAGLISTQPPPVIRLAVQGAETGRAVTTTAPEQAAIGGSE